MLRRAIVLALAAAAMWAPPRLARATADAGNAAHVPRTTQRARGGGHLKKQPLIMGVGLGCHSSSSSLRSTPSSTGFRADATGGAPMAASAGDLRSEYLQVLLSRCQDLQGQPAPSPSLSRAREFAAGLDFGLLDSTAYPESARRASASVRGAREAGVAPAVPRRRAAPGAQRGQDPRSELTYSNSTCERPRRLLLAVLTQPFLVIFAGHGVVPEERGGELQGEAGRGEFLPDY